MPILLLCTQGIGQKGHKTRKSSGANDNLESVILQCLGELCGYLDTLLDMRNSEKHWGGFEWPEWVGLVEKYFDFKKKRPSETKEK